MRLQWILLLLASAGCSTTTLARDLTRPPAVRWMDEHRGDTVVVVGRPGYQPAELAGTLLERTGDGVRVLTPRRGDRGGDVVLLDAPAVAGIRHRAPLSGAWRGALIGAGIGMLPAFLAGAFANACFNTCIDRERQPSRFATAFLITLSVPTLVGSLIGLMRGHLEELEVLEPPP